MKYSLVDKINNAIQANDTKTGLIPMGHGPQFPVARTYISPSDSYEDEIGFDDPLTHLNPGSIRPMWQVYEQQQAHIPVTNLTSSGNTKSNQLAALQGGIPQNPVAGATWGPAPQMGQTLFCTGPVAITANLTVHSSAANDSVGFALYRDGKLLGNSLKQTLGATASAASIISLSITDNPPTGNHVYQLYWSPGSGTLVATGNYRNFNVLNLTPQ